MKAPVKKKTNIVKKPVVKKPAVKKPVVPVKKAKPAASKAAAKPLPKTSKAKPAAKATKPATKAAKVVAKTTAKTVAKTSTKTIVKAPLKAKAKLVKKAPVKSAAKSPAKTAAKAPAKVAAKLSAKPATKVAAKASKKPAVKAAAKLPVKAPIKASVSPQTATKPAAKASAPIKKSTAVNTKPAAKPAATAKVATLPTAPMLNKAALATAPTLPLVPAVKPKSGKAGFMSPSNIAPKPMEVSTAAKTHFTTSSPVFVPPPPVAVKKDAKLVNNWKTKTAATLTDPEAIAMPDAEYMGKLQLAFFKLKLEQLKKGILNSAGETTEHLREDTSVVPDPADRATIEEEHALELRTRDRDRKLLKKIEQSIQRIDADDYGYCDETGEPIGVARLIARPTASLSLEAQQRRELKQKMFGD